MIRVLRLGSARVKGEGLRIGTVRRPPRGVAKERFAAENWYDAWLPELAPSDALVKQAMKASSDKDWDDFRRKYRKEMAQAERARLLELLAALSQTTAFSVGCYCEDEARCHRSVLRELLAEKGARLAAAGH
ncbi:MAG TPA: DUF488 family protein [Burkholderiales bacterium]